jgi:hypothetical protein
MIRFILSLVIIALLIGCTKNYTTNVYVDSYPTPEGVFVYSKIDISQSYYDTITINLDSTWSKKAFVHTNTPPHDTTISHSGYFIQSFKSIYLYATDDINWIATLVISDTSSLRYGSWYYNKL